MARQSRRYGAYLWGQAATARVLRGGSWVVGGRLARCAFRLRLIPDNFNNNVGFRVVVSIALSLGQHIPSFTDAGRSQKARASPA